jgi:3-methylcrotonyl-CoA carboxylase alpha subunit
VGEVTIRRLLVPNRGEIAARIARTCREMEITSIIASAADDMGSFVSRVFDEQVLLGDGDPRETYLNVERIVEVAREARADAIHPGYGFLSERAALVRACDAHGITFVGPTADAMDLMGSKSASRARMEELGVPVVPGYHGDDQSSEGLLREAERIGFPLIVKASAGGGGKGMRIVRDARDLEAAVEAGRREAMKAFGDDRLLIEKLIERPRHVEFQVFGDSHGNVVHLFERDCSVQRRHQKIVEESPAPRMSDDLRARMADAAIRAAKGVGYRNAGTVEFILTPEGEFYFLEMNTRLQVEHPVTEMVLGVDLVRAQLEVASGSPLPWRQSDLWQRGHAIEVRIYAEDPDNGFLPQTGEVLRYSEPGGGGVRVDSGITRGSSVSVRYDPILSKLIVHAETRASAIERMGRALADYTILGTRTNLPYLRRILRHPAYGAGEVTTHFVEEHAEDLGPAEIPGAADVAAALMSAGGSAIRRQRRGDDKAKLPSVWELIGQRSW